MSQSGKKRFENDTAFCKSALDQDRSAIVICNLNHEIIYMNLAAVRKYEKHEYRNAETMGRGSVRRTAVRNDIFYVIL